MSDSSLINGDAPSASLAVTRYENIQPRLPQARFPDVSIHRAHLEDLCDEFDCFVLDGFGVLNIGADTVPGAVDRVLALRAQGMQVRVLTNGASFPVSVTRAKYHRWGLDFEPGHVISSRDALAREMAAHADKVWGFAALPESELQGLAPQAVLLQDNAADYERCDGFVLLGTGNWTAARQQLLKVSLAARPRPVLVGNPDLVAPQAGGLSREPGLYAHDIADSRLVMPTFFGKPFDNAFSVVRETVQGIDPQRIAMVGDTLHTDILGGAQAGWRTVLVTDHGLLKGLDVEQAIQRSGIRPDFIIPTT
ncbi:HAD-IIA family hydrolase [Granulosicoccus sp. 3-233]|uniref:HAD-IIA family hydrolase n=1 Tax=Granulosicoccus sp. 3-233 TaxID=3417969 RepID=UPI003D34B941